MARIHKRRDVSQAILRKVNPSIRPGKERNGDIFLDGEFVTRITFPKSNTGDLPPGTAKSIRNQLLLTTGQFDALVVCEMTGPEYYEAIRQKKTDGFV